MSAVGAPVTISKNSFDDHSEPDDHGMYEYRYQGWIYSIRVGDITYSARMYLGDDEVPHFLKIERLGSRRWIFFDSIPYDDGRFAAAVWALLAETERSAVDIFAGGKYQPVDLSRLRPRP